MSTTVVHVGSLPVDWFLDPKYVYIGRARQLAGLDFDGTFGNPFHLAREADRERIVHLYSNWFLRKVHSDPEFRAAIRSLRGKTLVCFCHPKACHGDVIAAWLNGGE